MTRLSPGFSVPAASLPGSWKNAPSSQTPTFAQQGKMIKRLDRKMKARVVRTHVREEAQVIYRTWHSFPSVRAGTFLKGQAGLHVLNLSRCEEIETSVFL